jgi:hypothetical protein
MLFESRGETAESDGQQGQKQQQPEACGSVIIGGRLPTECAAVAATQAACQMLVDRAPADFAFAKKI